MILEEAVDLEIFRKAAVIRAFEEETYKNVENKNVKIPVYLCAGQEYIAATFATFFQQNPTEKKHQIFIQHRGHGTYIAFGGNLDQLALELLGHKDGCANGMGGSASIQSKENLIYGHDGLMGSHGPIAVGACFGNKRPTLCFIGDAAAEEDYFLACIGWASTKKLPIWFIVEDNNLSILTEKKVRRNWEMSDVAKSFGIEAFNIEDDPAEIWANLDVDLVSKPCLFNINYKRIFYHAGAGIDDPDIRDRQKIYIKKYGSKIVEEAKSKVKVVWDRCLKKI